MFSAQRNERKCYSSLKYENVFQLKERKLCVPAHRNKLMFSGSKNEYIQLKEIKSCFFHSQKETNNLHLKKINYFTHL